MYFIHTLSFETSVISADVLIINYTCIFLFLPFFQNFPQISLPVSKSIPEHVYFCKVFFKKKIFFSFQLWDFTSLDFLVQLLSPLHHTEKTK